jgi:carbamoyltransferase
MKYMYILGINAYTHDTSAAIVRDGEVVAVGEEERFIRQKHTWGFPAKSIEFCVEEAGIGFNDIGYIAFSFKPFLCLKRILKNTIKYLPDSLSSAIKEGRIWSSRCKVKKRVANIFNKGVISYRFIPVKHHLAHAASSFFISPFEKSAIISMDAVGEDVTTFLGYGEGNKIIPVHEIKFPHSLGFLYNAFTIYLGFGLQGDEGKVMGLAPYGRPSYIDFFRKIVRMDNKGGVSLDISFFDFHKSMEKIYGDKLVRTLGPARKKGEELKDFHKDIAASLQMRLEEVGIELAQYIKEKTKSSYLCLAGGVSLNSVMNYKILKEAGLKGIFIQPAAYDGGTSLGAALYLYHHILGNKRNFKLEEPAFGPCYSDEEIEKLLGMCKIEYRRSDDVAKDVANLIADGNIVGWFQGKSEIGPRALGYRSILADPRRPDMKDLLNSKVKFREGFRPYAPSVLEEDSKDFFESLVPSPYMLLVFDVKEEKRSLIPAITHVDGTARVQTVTSISYPLYHRLISEFKKITGIPMILNTSFNIMGEPMVSTPADALRCFFSTGMDALAIGSFIIEK